MKPAMSHAAGARAPLRELDAALSDLLAHAQPLGRTEWLDTLQADGRVLAQDLVSALHVPAFDNSSMDGYALRGIDLGADQPLPVSQRIAAGHAACDLQPGTAARVFTGARIPPGADVVVPQEDCQVGADGCVRICTPVQPGQFIRRAGEDIARGTTVLQKGERLTPASLGLAASIGLAQVGVAERVRVALLSTGDELVLPGQVAPQDMPPGAIYNSNRYVLKALLERLGCLVTDLGVVPDQRAATLNALAQAAQTHDLIVTSGGVSVGEEDHVKPAVQALGALDLWQIAIKPGKPFAYGHLRRGADPAAGRAHFIGLPGNPVSSYVTALLLVAPFVRALQGARQTRPSAQLLRADFDWPRPDKRREFLRVRRNAQGGLDLFANQSSGVLTSCVWADGLVDNPSGHAIARGETVAWISMAEFLG